jgi:hypothetical protein
MLQTIIDYSFPNGVPEYNTSTPNTEDDIMEQNILNKLKVGNKFQINTLRNSPYEHLNEKYIYILSFDDNGLTCGYSDNGTNKYNYLKYSKKHVPTFVGISKLIPLDKQDKTDLYSQLAKSMEELVSNKSLYFDMKGRNGITYKVDKDMNVVYPKKINR